MHDFWENAKKSISAGAIAPALDLLHQSLEEDWQDQVLLYRSMLAKLQDEERLFGSNKQEDRARLSWQILQFIRECQNRKLTMPKGATTPRYLALLKRRDQAIELLNEWEEKLELAESPSERKRSEREIARIKGIIQGYTDEMQQLTL